MDIQEKGGEDHMKANISDMKQWPKLMATDELGDYETILDRANFVALTREDYKRFLKVTK